MTTSERIASLRHTTSERDEVWRQLDDKKWQQEADQLRFESVKANEELR